MARLSSSLRRPAVFGALALAVVAGGVYGTARLRGNSGTAACSASATIAARLAPLARGELAAFEVSGAPTAAPDVFFAGSDGARLSLAGFRGRTVLLNLWATWCEPCKREMPALDRIQAELGGAGFETVAVNIDTRDTGRPRRWLEQAGIRSLRYYADDQARIFQDLRRVGDAEGLPTTLLVGPDGCRLGRLAGWAEWASPEGFALLRAAIPAGAPG